MTDKESNQATDTDSNSTDETEYIIESYHQNTSGFYGKTTAKTPKEALLDVISENGDEQLLPISEVNNRVPESGFTVTPTKSITTFSHR